MAFTSYLRSKRLRFSILLASMILLAIANSNLAFASTSSSQTSSTTDTIGGTAVTSPTQTATNNQPCSYQVFTDGTTTYAQSCGPGPNTGEILIHSTSASAVISDSIGNMTDGGVDYIHNGTYTISQQINILKNNVTIEGAGAGTILKASSTITGAYGTLAVLYLYEVSHVIVENLAIDGSRASQSSSCTKCTGIEADLSNYVTFQNLYVHDVETFCMSFEGTSYSEMINNHLVNCNANGINTYNYSSTQLSVGDTIQGNTILTASDVGISVTSMDTLFEGNTISNMTLNESPFSLNTHLGFAIGDTGNATDDTFLGNNLLNVAADAINLIGSSTQYNRGIVINGNHMVDCGAGVVISYVRGVSVLDNLIQSTLSTSVAAIKLDTGTTDAEVSGNMIDDTIYTAILSQASAALITDNWITEISRFAASTKVVNILADNNTVSDNTIDLSAASAFNSAAIEVSNTSDQVIGNTVMGYGTSAGTGIALAGLNDKILGNKVGAFHYCINKAGTPIGGLIAYNTISDCSGGNFIIGSTNQASTTWTYSTIGNIGYNPKVHLTSPFDNTDHYIVDGGASATPTNKTVYTVNFSPKIVYVTVTASYGTSTMVIQIDGTQVFSGTPPVGWSESYSLAFGETFYIQYRTADTSINVSGQ